MFLEIILGLGGVFIGGLIGFTITAYTNSYRVIKKRTKAEAIQKLELESIIGIINGTQELRAAIIELDYRLMMIAGEFYAATKGKTYKAIKSDKLNKLDDMLEVIRAGKESPSKITLRLNFKVEEYTQAYDEKIENFIFLLKKDMVINEEDEAVRKEIKEIEKIHEKLDKIFNYETPKKITGFAKVAKEIFDKAGNTKVEKKINESVERILKIYKKKLN